METAKKKIKKNGLEGTPGKGRGRSKGKTKEIGKMDDKEEGVWKIVCSTSDEWEEIVDRLRECKKTEARRLYNFINDELLPEVLYLLQQKVIDIIIINYSLIIIINYRRRFSRENY